MKVDRLVFVDKKLERLFGGLSDKDPIKKGLVKAIKDIREDFRVGRLITRDTHNKSRIRRILDKYGVVNLRVYNLPSAWRMIYSVTGLGDIRIVAVVLDWMSHKDYEKMLR